MSERFFDDNGIECKKTLQDGGLTMGEITERTMRELCKCKNVTVIDPETEYQSSVDR